MPFRIIALFKFKEMWFLESDFKEVVDLEWNRVSYSSNPSKVFALKIKALKFHLRDWNHNSVGSRKANKESCRRRIKELDLLEENRDLSSV